MNSQRAAQDDGKIVDEIEKTIQGLLNLNIFESFSNSEDNDSKNNVSEGSPDATTNDVSGTSEDKTSAESHGKEVARGKLGQADGSDASATLFGQHSDSKNEERELEKKEFVRECTQKIIKKIESDNV